MSIPHELERFAMEQFAFLEKDYGFRSPQIRQDGVTTIDYLNETIAVELEIDWRELHVFVLIVRLEGTQLPKGYYMSGGRKCRVLLLNLVRESKWGLDEEILSRMRARARAHPKSVEDLEAEVVDGRTLVMSCIDRILENNVELFEGPSK